MTHRKLLWVMLFVTIGVSVLYVRTRFLVIQLSYQVRAIQKDLDRVSQKREMLKLELSMLESPGRVQELASEKLALSIHPNPQTIVLSERAGVRD